MVSSPCALGPRVLEAEEARQVLHRLHQEQQDRRRSPGAPSAVEAEVLLARQEEEQGQQDHAEQGLQDHALVHSTGGRGLRDALPC